MKAYLASLLERVIQRIADRTAARLAEAAREVDAPDDLYVPASRWDPLLRRKGDELAGADKGTQILLSHLYRLCLAQDLPPAPFGDVEFRCYSQFGEDGILLYLFSLLGTTTKQAVEICAGDGTECNAANLLLNHGWTGLLFDGDSENVTRGEQFFARCQETFFSPPTFVHTWVTAENVNALIRERGFVGDIDLLSLDLDGVDYWIWKAITCVRPRVVVLEYNTAWGPDRAVTVPYTPDFTMNPAQSEADQMTQFYFGASLPAFVKLGRDKGYRLVGCQRYGQNAFFLRADVGADLFPEVPAAACFESPLVKNYRWKHLWSQWPASPLNARLVEV